MVAVGPDVNKVVMFACATVEKSEFMSGGTQLRRERRSDEAISADEQNAQGFVTRSHLKTKKTRAVFC